MKSEQNYNVIDWWKKVFLGNYANFDGRARRAEYWYFTLGNIIILIPLYVLMIISAVAESEILMILSTILLVVFCLAIIIPSIAVTVRRLHDTNKSGWYYLLTLIPLLSLVVLIFTIIEGDKGENDYGKDPKDFSDDEIDQLGHE